MTAMIEQIPLGPEGREYVLGRLRAGHTLAQCLIEQWSGFRHAHTLLPHGIGTESLTDFASGGKLSAGRPDGGESVVRITNTNSVLIERIRKHLGAGEINACIFENAVAARSDPYVARLASVFFFEDEVYHYLLPSSRSDDTIAATVKAAKSIPQFIGVLTQCSVKAANLDRASVRSDFLQGVARDAQVIIAGAYDGESYVIVER
jgi:hypothetical protein